MSDSHGAPPRPEEPEHDRQACSEGMLRVPARASHLALVGMVVRWFGHRAGLEDDKCRELEVAVDEACTNIIRHAFPGETAGDVTILCAPLAGGLQVTILDKGQPFELDQAVQLGREKHARDPASGGMGWLLIRQLTDGVHYQHDEREGNRLTLIKHK